MTDTTTAYTAEHFLAGIRRRAFEAELEAARALADYLLHSDFHTYVTAMEAVLKATATAAPWHYATGAASRQDGDFLKGVRDAYDNAVATVLDGHSGGSTSALAGVASAVDMEGQREFIRAVKHVLEAAE